MKTKRLFTNQGIITTIGILVSTLFGVLGLLIIFNQTTPSDSTNSTQIDTEDEAEQNVETETGEGKVGMANPAAVYCTEMGYQFKIINTPSGGQDGICHLPNGEDCQAWDFLAGKCGPEYSYCAKQGYDLQTRNDGKDSLSPEYAVCISKVDGSEIGPVSELTDLTNKSVKTDLPPTNNDQEKENPDQINQTDENPPDSHGALPSSFDWRSFKGSDWTTPVKDQGNCGSCWSFSAIGVTEAVHNLNANDPTYDLNLSEQYFVSDCTSYFGYQNCCGGWKNYALVDIRDSGVPDETCLSYVDAATCTCTVAPTCDANCTYNSGGSCSDATCSDRCGDWASRLTTIEEYGSVSTNRTSIKQRLLEKGPLAVSFGYGAYYGGSWDGDVYRCTLDSGTNHAVVLTGYYDTGDPNTSYWIIKNSWGDTWGWASDGYLKIGYGECAIESSVYYADAGVDKVIIQNSSGTAKASLSDLGTIVLDGICTAGAACTAPSDSLIIQDSGGGTVGYIDSDGNLCVETGDCSDQSADCDSPTGDAFVVQDSLSNNTIYIDQTGDLCLTGFLIESGDP